MTTKRHIIAALIVLALVAIAFYVPAKGPCAPVEPEPEGPAAG